MNEVHVRHETTDTMDRIDEPSAAPEPGPRSALPTDLRARVREFERGLLLAALEATGGHQRRAAARLGLLPTTFHEKLKRHGIIG
jgi:DNA-binding NtrC family response regulator